MPMPMPEYDPYAYGPAGIPCGCGRPAHSSLQPCRPGTPAPVPAAAPVPVPVPRVPAARPAPPPPRRPQFPPPVRADGEPVRSRAGYEHRIRHSGLPPTVRLVALVLASYTNSLARFGDRQPSLRTLRRATGLHQTRLYPALDHLEAGGWLAVGGRAPGGGYDRPVTLALRLPPLADPPRGPGNGCGSL